MFEPVFHSKLGPSMDIFIGQKRAAGYPYDGPAMILGHFDALVAEQFPDSTTLTKEICDAWISSRSSLHPNTLLRSITPVRQYGKYLVGTGVDAYIIPDKIPFKRIHYDAHIFTDEELVAFFNAVDQCPRSPYSRARCYVIPVIFRLLYTCGLRSSEARMLHVDDVDLNTGMVTICQSKGWEARINYVSADMLDLLRRFDTIVSHIFPDREAFFPNQNGTYYNREILDVWFHEFWDPLPEAAVTKGNKPRVHDFRHTYCVHRLNKWVAEGMDVDALYVYLSEFVGHSNFADTDYYLTLSETFYPEFQRRMSPVNTK
ncbi:MAG: tyrosine-type recombinase/integrase, partial [Clostridiales bacterium]|nr:tyrosine-type recombinase/integrase [Clostridiales bacterium]